jgi:hypothetical protein
MALKYIDQAWRNDQRVNFAHRFNFYINPRGRVLPALTSAGVSYVKNTSVNGDNMRGTYRMQTGATTSLTYLYTMPQRFIIEGWIKPGFAYNVAGNQTLFQCGDAAEFSIIYNATTDKIDMIQSPGTTLSTSAFTSDADLQQWLRMRAWYDNTNKLAGLYVTRSGVALCDSQNVPGAGDFIPLNTISFLPGVTAQSSCWVIHELDETLATGKYKTYQADRQIIFDFNGTTLGRERIRIPVVHTPTDTRGVKSFSLSKSVENPMTGSAGANTASMTLYNINGQFSDDQYDAFDPFQGRYNGTQKYLQNRVGVEIESDYQIYTSKVVLFGTTTLFGVTMYGNLATSNVEPVFIGRTTPGSFRRSSPSKFYGEVSIDIEDGISELGETKLRRAYGFDTFDLSDPASEATSLYHSIARLVTKKEIRNYIGNSSVENATIANSWTNTGMATFERSSTYAQFGTYSMKCIADTIGDKVTQRITFVGDDKIDVDDVFNFACFIRQGTASAVKIMIEETDSGGTIIGSASETACGTDTARFTLVNVPRTILSSSCVGLRVTIQAVATSTFYADGFMLTRGIDPFDWFIVNANDGTAGVISADSYTAGTYDSVAIDADAVDIAHPYALVEKGNTAWDALKKIGDASIAAYNGMSPDGVLQFRVRYNSDDMENLGDIENFGGVATSLDVAGANSIKVHGVKVIPENGPTQVFNGAQSGLFATDTGSTSNMLHPINSASFLESSGATTFELKYEDTL